MEKKREDEDKAVPIERKNHQKQTKDPYNLGINKNTQKALET
jgi:hypothetical protein